MGLHAHLIMSLECPSQSIKLLSLKRLLFMHLSTQLLFGPCQGSVLHTGLFTSTHDAQVHPIH